MDYPDGDLTIDPDGLEQLAQWRRRSKPEDADLVNRMLRDISRRQWHGVWSAEDNFSKPGVKTFEPRPGLYVHVVLWADVDQFSIDGFSDVPPEGGED